MYGMYRIQAEKKEANSIKNINKYEYLNCANLF